MILSNLSLNVGDNGVHEFHKMRIDHVTVWANKKISTNNDASIFRDISPLGCS